MFILAFQLHSNIQYKWDQGMVSVYGAKYFNHNKSTIPLKVTKNKNKYKNKNKTKNQTQTNY